MSRTQEPTGNRTRCAGRTAARRRCRNRPGAFGPFCHWHQPRRTAIEYVGGPFDGRAITLRETRGYRVVFAGRLGAGEPLAPYLPVDRRGILALGGQIVGSYQLTYRGLTPAWVWVQDLP